jgi:hypothetical protein
MSATFTKTCTCCGRTHDAASWAALPWPIGGSRGMQCEDDDGNAYVLELKNCDGCNSTIAIERPPDPSTEIPCHV